MGTGGPTGTFLNREYIWGPGDRGVDELLCQYDWQRKPWFTLMDDGGDLVALCDRDPSTLRGRVAAEYTYDAYGAVLTAATYSSMSANAYPHLGHKGLFVDRLDAGIVGGSNYETPRLYPLSSPLAQNRNRAYSPGLGTFLQADPNESGQSLLAAASYNGRGAAAIEIVFGLKEHYAPDLNHYDYLGFNPWNQSDPLGLDPRAGVQDPFDMVDEFQAEYMAEGAVALDNVHAGVAASKIFIANVLSMVPIIGPVGEIWKYVLGEQSLSMTIVWSLVDLIPVAHPVFAAAGWAYRGVSLWLKLGKNAKYVGRVIRWGGRLVELTAEAAEHIGKILPYDQAAKLTAGFCHAIEAHHLIPNRYMHLIPGLGNSVVPAVVLARDEHLAIEELILQSEHALGHAPRNSQDLWQILSNAYEGFDEYTSAIEGFFP